MNTQYEHAGNADQLRELQNAPVARCNICHFHLGQEVGSETIRLQPEVGHSENTNVILVCQLCTELIRQAGGTLADAIKMARPLRAEDEAENQKLLKEFNNE